MRPCDAQNMSADDWEVRPGPEDAPEAITGSLFFAALSVLDGGPYTISSMLEGGGGGLYIGEKDIAGVVKPLVRSLHDLFYQPGSAHDRKYNRRATAADVREVCRHFMPSIELG